MKAVAAEAVNLVEKEKALLYEAQVLGSDWCYPDVLTHLRVSTGVIPVKEAVVLASQSKFPKEKHFSRNDATTQR